MQKDIVFFNLPPPLAHYYRLALKGQFVKKQFKKKKLWTFYLTHHAMDGDQSENIFGSKANKYDLNLAGFVD